MAEQTNVTDTEHTGRPAGMYELGKSGALAGIRVLDLATPMAEMAGRVLADLGADVLKLEPASGAAARQLPPFARDNTTSLYWAAVARGKRTATLDITDARNNQQLHALLAEADILIECCTHAEARAAGLMPAAVAARHPHLVHVSVTAFGRTGPKADAPASDLTLEAAGGLLGLQGDGDRPPVPIGFPQASFHAGVQAAADALIALYARRAHGHGQHLDVSAQQAMVWTLMNATGYLPLTGADAPGTGELRATPAEAGPGVRLPRSLRCADGHVLVGLAVPGISEKTMARLLHHALEHRKRVDPNAPDDSVLAQVDWTQWLAPLREGRIPAAVANLALQRIAEWAATRSKRELQALAVEEGILIANIQRPGELLADPQLVAREFWLPIDGRRHPGPFAKLSGTPIDATRPAPTRGDEAPAFARRGGRRATIAAPASAAPASAAPACMRVASAAFAGLKVADFAWVGVGPIISKALADHGATVVHVESAKRPDVLRNLPPFLHNERGLDRSHFMANFNTNKLGMALDLSGDPGRTIARELSDWADVVVESFTAGTMARMGLDYATLSANRRDLVMLSTCMRGQTGPENRYSGFGGQGAALAGMVAITGWPDRAPAGPWGAYTDFIAPRFGISALLAALHHRADTGHGQYIDLSQIEAGIQFIEPLILDCAEHSRDAPAPGHYSMFASPHGVYACAGCERYLALSVATPAQWQALASVLGDRALSDDRYASEAMRRIDAHRIDEAIRIWCADKDAFAAAEQLRSVGVPAEAVRRPADLYLDAQLNHRGHFVALPHPVLGNCAFDGLATRFSNAICGPTRAAPTLGQHTDEVLQNILGYSAQQTNALREAGVLT